MTRTMINMFDDFAESDERRGMISSPPKNRARGPLVKSGVLEISF